MISSLSTRIIARPLLKGLPLFMRKLTDPTNFGFTKLGEHAWKSRRSAFLIDMMSRNSNPDLAGFRWFLGLLDHYSASDWCRAIGVSEARLSSLTVQIQFDLGTYRVKKDQAKAEEAQMKFVVLAAARDHRGRMVADTRTGWVHFPVGNTLWVG